MSNLTDKTLAGILMTIAAAPLYAERVRQIEAAINSEPRTTPGGMSLSDKPIDRTALLRQAAEQSLRDTHALADAILRELT